MKNKRSQLFDLILLVAVVQIGYLIGGIYFAIITGIVFSVLLSNHAATFIVKLFRKRNVIENGCLYTERAVPKSRIQPHMATAVRR